tara:strand:- start:377 stop:787 length:411 start_codon:yes stop_codon:yes gene_type:complete
MKKVILTLAVIAAIGLTSFKKAVNKEVESVKTTVVSNEMQMTDLSFGVRGNCGMCKNTIEKAVNSLEGISNVNWDVEKKNIDVSFDETKTNEMAIHNAIAASGYDTEKVAGNEDAYKDLPGCCQYDHEMAINKSAE